MCCYNGAQRYEQFLQVGWLYRALILLGLALCFPSTSVSLVFVVLYINFFCLHHFLYLLVSWAWWDWPLMWLTNRHLSVLWHCWLGHVTRKIVSEMTYNVSSGTLNSTIPYKPNRQTALVKQHKTCYQLLSPRHRKFIEAVYCLCTESLVVEDVLIQDFFHRRRSMYDQVTELWYSLRTGLRRC